MLRMIFSDLDLTRVRVAGAPDPLWEITNSLDRLQTRHIPRSLAPWVRESRSAIVRHDLTRAVRDVLIPLLPRAAYFPDFLTPLESTNGLDAGIDAILGTPRSRVMAEMSKLDRLHGAPGWGHRVADHDVRTEVVDALRSYHDRVVAPHESTVRAAVDGDRAYRTRALLDGGVDGLLASYRPMMSWRRPVLEISYPVNREIRLTGEGLLLIPSYFCWKYPVALSDAALPQTLVYPALAPTGADRPGDDASTAALIGTTRAAVLRTTETGATTGEVARIVGIGEATASHHLTILRNGGLISSRRRANTVVHMLAPLGRSLLASGAADA